jgi:hypothetical protein
VSRFFVGFTFLGVVLLLSRLYLPGFLLLCRVYLLGCHASL